MSFAETLERQMSFAEQLERQMSFAETLERQMFFAERFETLVVLLRIAKPIEQPGMIEEPQLAI